MEPKQEERELGVFAPSPGRRGDVRVFKGIDSSKPAAVLEWSGLGFSVQAGKNQRRQILTDLAGDLRPGELTCILGPSGSGKTSLLNVLAGRARSGGRGRAEILGSVRVNGKEIDPAAHQQLFGYVMQDDALLGTMTPREVLDFAARLRLGSTSPTERAGLIADLLLGLGIDKCADTVVGSALIKGISGGERKRTAVGAELITNPEITFLDEPTSGLDSAAALDVVSLLKQLTRAKRSVLCTIHQPSSEIFYLFDQAIFLVGGRVAYHGPPNGIRAHFSTMGLSCPASSNPADFVMFSIQRGDAAQIDRIVSGWGAAEQRPAPLHPEGPGELPEPPQQRGFCAQLAALTVREAKKVARDRATLRARVGQTIFLNVIYVLVFNQVGAVHGDGVFDYDRQSHAGALMMVGIAGTMSAAQPLLLTFAAERPVFIREYAGNMYGVFPYFLSKAMIELPMLALQGLAQWLIVYWGMAMHGNFGLAWLGTLLIAVSAASTALFAGTLAATQKRAMEMGPALFLPQILLAGFFIKMEMLPVFLQWAPYVCSLRWGMTILMVNEFADLPGGKLLLEANGMAEGDLPMSIGILVGISVFFRIVAAFTLRWKARAFYN